MRPPMPGHGFGTDAAAVPDIAAAIEKQVGVDPLGIEAWLRDTDAIFGPRQWREIANDHRQRAGLLAPAQECDHAALVVGGIDPLEALGLAILFVQGRQSAVRGVQIAHQRLGAAVITQQHSTRVRRAAAGSRSPFPSSSRPSRQLLCASDFACC